MNSSPDPDAESPRPKVSVCVVTYNQAYCIADCLAGVLAQAVDVEIEILVGDDGSGDGTQEIVAGIARRFPGVVRLVEDGTRLGSTRNYRRLVEMARGEFIAHLDGDDLWLPGKLRTQVEALERDPVLAASCTNAMLIDGAGELAGMFTDSPDGVLGVDDLLVNGNFLTHSSLLYRRRWRDRLLALHYPTIDFDFHLNLAASGGIHFDHRAWTGYRVNAAGSQVANDNSVVRERYWNALASALASGRSEQVRELALADFLRRVAFRALRLRQPVLFVSWWRKAVGLAPRGRVRLAIATLAAVAGETLRQVRQFLRLRLARGALRTQHFRRFPTPFPSAAH